MNAVPQPCPGRMTADEFLAWAVGQDFRGELVGMSAERALHARVKARAYRALDDSVRAAALTCEAFPDGMALQVSGDSVFGPDATLRRGDPLPPDAAKMDDPVVVEVVSPSSRSNDSGTKLAAYFRLPSLRHYPILDGRARLAIHHAHRRRRADRHPHPAGRHADARPAGRRPGRGGPLRRPAADPP